MEGGNIYPTFGELPSRIKIKVIGNYPGPDILVEKKKIEDLNDRSIMSLFDFMSSKEGLDYWIHISGKLYNHHFRQLTKVNGR